MPITQERLSTALSTIKTLTDQRDTLKTAIRSYYEAAKAGTTDAGTVLFMLYDMVQGQAFTTPPHLYENYVGEIAHLKATASHNRAKRKWTAKKKLQAEITAYGESEFAQANDAAFEEWKANRDKAKARQLATLPEAAVPYVEPPFEELDEETQNDILRRKRLQALHNAGTSAEEYRKAMAMSKTMEEMRQQTSPEPLFPEGEIDPEDYNPDQDPEIIAEKARQQAFLEANPKFQSKE